MRRLVLLAFVLCAFLFPAAARADSPTHVVAYGETLYSIARQYGVSPQALASANGITTQSWVYAGQRLVIPTNASTQNNPSPATNSGQAASVAQASPSGTYVVRAGDSLSTLSRKFGISVAAIAEANNIPPNGFLYTGWQLKIPGAAKTQNNASTQPAQPTNRPADKTTTYIVQAGDTLYGIAIKHGVTMAAIRIANNLGTPFVYTAQRLIIPNSASPSNQSADATQNAIASSNEPALRVENVPVYKQQQTLTCEQAAASMALRGALTEKQIVDAMPRSENPFEGIRGSTNYELFGGLTHYGTYAQGLQKGLAKLGRQSTTYYGQSYEQFKASILENLKQGRPVIWWTTWRESYQRPQWTELANGIKIPLTPYEHSVVIVAADEQGVTYHDPYDGSVRTTTWANHQRTSSYFNNMALVIY